MLSYQHHSVISKETANKIIYISYGITLVILAILFVENFLFSSGMDLLRFRAIDDVAFHETLRKIHLSISHGHLHKLLVLNDYAYGWIFWLPLGLITYPFYLLSTHFSIDWPLIVLPRQISLIYGILSLVLLRKILLQYKWPEWLAALSVLVFSLFPSFAYFSLRFGTVNMVLFFSILSFYIAISDSPSSAKGRYKLALSLAVAGGVKLSGLLVAPLIFILVLFRYRFSLLTITMRDAAITGFIFAIFLILFSNPALLIAWLKPKYFHEYIATLSHFVEVTHIATGESNPWFRAYSVFAQSPIHFICLIFLSLGILLKSFNKNNIKLESLLIFTAFIALIIFLNSTIKNGLSAAVYFTAISYVLLFGIAYYGTRKSGIFAIGLITLLLISDIFVRADHTLKRNDDADSSTWSHLTYFIKLYKADPLIERSEKIKQCIQANSRDWNKHVFIDYTIPSGLMPLNYPQACISIAWNNLSENLKYCPRPLDYIVLDKSAPGALPDDLFLARLKKADPQTTDALLEDRKSRNTIMNGEMFDGKRFQEICNTNTTLVFRAEAIKE